ncbi:rRNA pseudouridine synthase [Verrucomicrobia bacterium]|nr:rRNA pseudouridine synthase [Verrucomicrobiota bacterium]
MRLRLQKYIAQSGICSRRAAEILIGEGKVLLNQSKVAQIGDSIDPNIDSVSVEGQTLRPRLKQYFLFHKPAKILCSKKDPARLPSLYQLLPPALQHVFYAGRLDFMSEGLLILTNDGAFSHQLTHPSFGIQKHYRVWLKSILNTESFLNTITNDGIVDDGELLKAKSAKKISTVKGVDLIEIVLCEGKNREIRRMIRAHHGKVIRLKRITMGPFSLNDLKAGKWRSFNQKELNFVKHIADNGRI